MCNCDDPIYYGQQPCPDCQPCEGCIEPKTMVVRRTVPIDYCEQQVDLVKDAISQPPSKKCDIQILSLTVIGKSVTVNIIPVPEPVQYSVDGVLFQDSPTFNNQECGKKKYFVRLRNFPACLVAGYATVNTDCECVKNYTLVDPPEPRCVDGKTELKRNDGCGGFDWFPTLLPCVGTCIPNFQDVVPQVRECVDNKWRYYQFDGCATHKWRETQEPCGNCQTPGGNLTGTITPASCDQNGNIQNNGVFVYFPVVGADRYGVSFGSSNGYTGPAYAQASSVPQNGVITQQGLNGYAYATSYTLRLFNGSNDCYVDRVINFPPVICTPTCVNPTGVLTKVDPTCSGSNSANNGSLVYSNHQNVTRFQVCQDTTFTCVPNYDQATPVTGSAAFTVLSGIGFASNQEYRDFTVRLYNGSANCYSDANFRFINPCYGGGGEQCTQPTHNTPVATQATCNGSTQNNNASISISGIANGNKYGYSAGSSYNGPSYASAVTIPGSTINVGGLTGSASPTLYTFRIFNGSNTCYKELTVTVPGRACSSQCAAPVFTLSSTPATCSGTAGQSNNNGKINISGITNGTKYQICLDTSFSCTPNFANSPVITGSGPIEVIDYLGFLPDQPSKTVFVRVYNGAENCYTDKSIVVNNPCLSCCSMQITGVEVNNGTTTPTPPIGQCPEGPEMRGVTNISVNGATFQFHGNGVDRLAWRVRQTSGSTSLRNGALNPSSQFFDVTFSPALPSGNYVAEVEGVSCSSPNGPHQMAFTIP